MNAVTTGLALAAQGVAWDKKNGAACPLCKVRMKMGSKQGEVRYCYCVTKSCILNVLKIGVKALAAVQRE